MRFPSEKLIWAFILLHLSTNGITRALPVSSLDVRSPSIGDITEVVSELDRRAGGGGGHGTDHPDAPSGGGGHGVAGRPDDDPASSGAATGGDGTTGGYHDSDSDTTGGFGNEGAVGKGNTDANTQHTGNTQNPNPVCIAKRTLSERGECFAPDGSPATKKFGAADQERLDGAERVVLDNGKTPRSNEELDAAYASASQKWSKPYDTSIDPRINQPGGLQKVYDENYKAERDLKDARPDQGDSKYIADAGLFKLGKDSSSKDVSVDINKFTWARYAVRSKANGKTGAANGPKNVFVDPEEAALVCKIGYDKQSQRVVIIAEQKAQKFDTNMYQTDNKGNQIFKNGKPVPIDDGGKTAAAQYPANSELAIRTAIKELKAQGVAEKDIKKAISEWMMVQQQVINMETQAVINRIFKDLDTSMDNRVQLSVTEPADAVWINRLEMTDSVKPGDNMLWSHPEYFAGTNPQELKDFWLNANTKTPAGGVYSTISYKTGYKY